MDKDGESGGRGGGSDSCQQYGRLVILTLTRSRQFQILDEKWARLGGWERGSGGTRAREHVKEVLSRRLQAKMDSGV